MSIKKLPRSSFTLTFTLFLACYSFYEDILVFLACHPFFSRYFSAEHKSPMFQNKGNSGKVFVYSDRLQTTLPSSDPSWGVDWG